MNILNEARSTGSIREVCKRNNITRHAFHLELGHSRMDAIVWSRRKHLL